MCFSCGGGWPWSQPVHLAAPPVKEEHVFLDTAYDFYPDYRTVSEESFLPAQSGFLPEQHLVNSSLRLHQTSISILQKHPVRQKTTPTDPTWSCPITTILRPLGANSTTRLISQSTNLKTAQRRSNTYQLLTRDFILLHLSTSQTSLLSPPCTTSKYVCAPSEMILADHTRAHPRLLDTTITATMEQLHLLRLVGNSPLLPIIPPTHTHIHHTLPLLPPHSRPTHIHTLHTTTPHATTTTTTHHTMQPLQHLVHPSVGQLPTHGVVNPPQLKPPQFSPSILS
jgi:hypothetical protein